MDIFGISAQLGEIHQELKVIREHLDAGMEAKNKAAKERNAWAWAYIEAVCADLPDLPDPTQHSDGTPFSEEDYDPELKVYIRR